MACHITHRGVDRRETHSSYQDRGTYLPLLQENLRDAQGSPPGGAERMRGRPFGRGFVSELSQRFGWY
jgi:hypothetical protein